MKVFHPPHSEETFLHLEFLQKCGYKLEEGPNVIKPKFNVWSPIEGPLRHPDTCNDTSWQFWPIRIVE